MYLGLPPCLSQVGSIVGLVVESGRQGWACEAQRFLEPTTPSYRPGISRCNYFKFDSRMETFALGELQVAFGIVT